jgi:hypothetical protein
MTSVIGLGKGGCIIADMLSQYPQYSAYKFDTGITKSKTSYPLKQFEKLEEYEEKTPCPKGFLKNVDRDILFVVCGGGKVSQASLKILEAVKDKIINIIYIRPELSLLNDTQARIEKMTYNVFQEFARSGLFNSLLLVSNESVKELLGGLSIKDYHERINEAIVSNFHMINVYQNNSPLVNTFDKRPIGSRIRTMGVCDLVSGQEKLFFPLDSPTDIEYYYAYNKEEVENSRSLLENVRKNIEDKKKVAKRVTYGVYETEYEENYLYCVRSTSIIQQ